MKRSYKEEYQYWLDSPALGEEEWKELSSIAEDEKEVESRFFAPLELDEVMSLSDRILVMYEGEIVGELDPKATNVQELGLYMAGAKRTTKAGEQV